MSVTGISLADAHAAPANAAKSATPWTKISKNTGLGIASAGLFRTGDGRLHVVWSSQDGGSNYSLHYSTVGGREKLLATGTIKSHWGSMSFFPRLVAGPKGGIRLVFGGANGVSGSPYNSFSMYTATSDSAGKSWKLSTSGLSHDGVPATDIAAADEPNRTPIAAWSEVTSLAYHVGIDPQIPAKAPDQKLGIGADGGLVDPTLIRTKSGAILAGWFNNSNKASAGYWTAQLLPKTTKRVRAPHSGSLNQANGQPLEPVALVARQGGGNYLAYCVPTHVLACGHVALWRVGAKRALTVPGSSSGAARFVAISADRGGHLWIAWFNEQTSKISVVRTNAAANAFGQVRTFSVPPRLADFEGLEAEGSAGPLDLIALETQNGGTPAWFATQIDPALRIRASKSRVSSTQSTPITFTVVDAGDAVAGAKVTFLGHTATTNSKGRVNFTVKKGTAKGKHTVVATKSGYASATFTVKVT